MAFLHDVAALIQSAPCTPVSFSITRADWFRLLVAALSGAFGGILYGIVALLEGGRDSKQERSNRWHATKGVGAWWYIAGQGAIGVGGACAAIFALVTLARAASGESTLFLQEDHLYFVVLCVIGGFIANRLLAVVGDKLLNELKSEQRQQRRELAGFRRDLSEQQKRFESQPNVITDVFAGRDVYKAIRQLQNERDELQGGKAAAQAHVADPNARLKEIQEQLERVKTLAEDYIKKLTGYSAESPEDRSLHIVLANLHSAKGEHSKAVEVLKQFINNRHKAGTDKGEDLARAWYNLSCEYCAQVKEEAGLGHDAAEKKRDALAALEKSLEIAKEAGGTTLEAQKAQIKEDEKTDLGTIREEPQFKKLVHEYRI